MKIAISCILSNQVASFFMEPVTVEESFKTFEKF